MKNATRSRVYASEGYTIPGMWVIRRTAVSPTGTVTDYYLHSDGKWRTSVRCKGKLSGVFANRRLARMCKRLYAAS